MNIGWNIETYVSIISLILAIVISIIILKTNWKQYGFLYLLSAVIGMILCYIFIYLDFYPYVGEKTPTS